MAVTEHPLRGFDRQCLEDHVAWERHTLVDMAHRRYQEGLAESPGTEGTLPKDDE